MSKFSEVSANPIYELELLPVLVAYVCGKEHLSNTQTVFYLDNDAARAGLIKAFSAIQHAEAIVERVTKKKKLMFAANLGTVGYQPLPMFRSQFCIFSFL